MARSNGRLIALGCVSVGVLATLSVSSPTPGGGSADYDLLDQVEGSYLNFNLFPVRPLLAHPSGTGFFALNTHDSTVERFDGASTNPVDVWDVPWGPVALTIWNDPVSTDDRLLVSCRGSSVLAQLDISTGEVIDLLSLPPEPADVIVKQSTNQAFVACSAKDIVVQIDLLTNAKVEYSIDSHPDFDVKSPTFLALSNSGKVMVPSFHSGNNSTSSRIFQRRGGEVIDLEDPDYAVQGLPDHDLFRIDPVAQAVVPIGKRIGTTLFGIGVNPDTTRTWVLNTDAKNKGPSRQTEQAVRGDVVANRISIIRPNITDPPPEPDSFIDLDDTDLVTAGIQFDREQSVGQPFNLDFRSNGNAFIVGLLTDNLIEVDKDGVRLNEWDLPKGSIPRGVTVDEAGDRVWVHCWGNNQVLEYQLSNMALLRTCQLSNDPTPANIAKGRELFYDASHSEHNNASCASCHIEGRHDFLTWNLSNDVVDEKGPLLTQSMFGLDRLAPFHWRGERAELSDFNPAFDGLMGGAKLRDKQFQDFEDFVFSLTNPANPWASRERQLDDTSIPYGVDPSASAVQGQIAYQTFQVQGTNFCTSCHQLPLGTNHDIFSGEPTDDIPRRVFNKVTPFNETYRRLMDVVQIETLVEPGNPGAGTVVDSRGYLGVSATHSGLIESFVERIADFGGGANTFHMTSFVMQLDSGVAPAIHEAFLLDAANLATTQPELENYLMPQMSSGNCDVVVFGRSEPNSVTTRWYWNRQSGTFEPDHATLASRSLNDFINAAGTESHVFMGVPVGMGARMAVDRDLDGLINATDPAPLDPFVDPADTTKPALTSAPRLAWVSSRMARISFATNEPSIYRITYGEGVLPDRVVEAKHYSRVHAPLLKELLPSTLDPSSVYPVKTFTYESTIELIDRAGNIRTLEFPAFDSGPYGPKDDEEVVVGNLEWTQFNDEGPGPLRARAKIRTDYKHGGPPSFPAPERVVLSRVIVDGQINSDWTPLGPNSFKVDHMRAVSGSGFKDLNVEGPFLVGFETDAQGETKVGFELAGLAVGQQVALNLDCVVQMDISDVALYRANLAAANDCAVSGGPGTIDCDGDSVADCCLEVPVVFHGRVLTRWSVPDTKPRHRQISERFDPGEATLLSK